MNFSRSQSNHALQRTRPSRSGCAYEQQLLLRRDTEAQERFCAEDFVVTNPFNMFIDKKKVMERIRADIIKYIAPVAQPSR